MAWQLIYTSAPRLLEAGRSGFGTVARHRQISPLLVSAIERASQFARLSGLSADRVIFAHRIIAIGGGRFHVLSSIRDAGADYTGRTNHIAHHLIAEPREIARLGADGPSPADVLLAMPWVSTWDEHPRHLEAADEIALADFAPGVRTDGVSWGGVTGDPADAWLLANGEASRGAYLIVPTRVDLRELLADSFRLVADHAWPHGFITSLQPSDEASDFRWIGIENDSPLRSHASASARLVLDLTSPSSLPAPEVPVIAKRPLEIPSASQEKESAARRADALPPKGVEARTSAASEGSASGTTAGDPGGDAAAEEAARRERRARAQRRTPAPTDAAGRASAPRHMPMWAWVAIVAVLAGAGACYLALRPMLQRREAQRKVAGLLESSGYFGDEPARIGIAKELVPDAQAEQQAAAAARAADRLAWSLSSADFAKMKSSQSAADLLSLSSAGAQMPVELGKLRELVRRVLALYESPEGAEKAQDANALDAIFAERKKEILSLIHGTGREANLGKLTKELIAQADRNHARALLALIQNPILPAEGVKAFEKVAADFARGTSDLEALKTVAQIREAIAQRKRKPRKTPGPVKVETPPAHDANETPPFKQAGPIYLVAGNDALAAVKIKELRPGAVFHLATPGGQTRELIATADKLRLDFQRPSAAFLLSSGDAQTIRASDDAPKPPYGLFGESKESGKFEIWVVPGGSTNPLPETQNAALTRSADILRISGALPKFSGVLALFLRSPAGMDGKPEPLALPVNDAWEADLAPLVSELRKTAAAQRAEAKTLRKNATATKDPPSLEALQKKANEYAKVFTDQYAKREFSPSAKTGNEIVGNYAVALVTEWGKNYDQNLENLRAWGHNLRESDGKPAIVKDLNESLRKEVLALEQKYRSSKMTGALANLRDLANTLATMLGDTKGLEAAAKTMSERANADDASAERIEKLPLLTDGKHPPAGDYALIARTALDREVVIATFKIQKP